MYMYHSFWQLKSIKIKICTNKCPSLVMSPLHVDLGMHVPVLQIVQFQFGEKVK